MFVPRPIRRVAAAQRLQPFDQIVFRRPQGFGRMAAGAEDLLQSPQTLSLIADEMRDHQPPAVDRRAGVRRLQRPAQPPASAQGGVDLFMDRRPILRADEAALAKIFLRQPIRRRTAMLNGGFDQIQQVDRRGDAGFGLHAPGR